MAGELTPTQAAILADSAYAVQRSPGNAGVAAAAEVNAVDPALREAFDIVNATVFNGLTGASAQSNFGFVAHGTGTRQGETLVSVRGTVTGADWLTNGNCAWDSGPSGSPVHQGFNQLTKSILPQIKSALQGRNPTTMHFVGHSLGGATATLLADAVGRAGGAKLYTFGAPRTGLGGHTGQITAKLGQSNIFRVYHDTDPVPMIPVFPFSHAPAPGLAHLMKGSGAIIWPGAHSMEGYIRNVSGATWRSLPRIPHRRFSLDTVDDVLKQAGQLPGGYLDALLMRLLVKALGLLLRAAGIIVANGVQEGITILDQIVVATQHAWRAASDTVETLVRQIMRFLGIVKDVGREITAQFLRWLLNKLFAVIATLAANAINRFVR
ncbi:MAG: lipase family protein [Rhizobiaceae bacterium]